MLNREVTCTDKFAELRKQAQAQLEKEIESMEPLAPEKTRELFHELRTQQIELELQNEELRQAQARLQNMQQRYSGLYDFAPIGYLTIGVNGNIIEANLTASIMFGVERSNLIRQPFSAFVVPENQDTYYYFRKELLHSQKSSDCELELARRDGSRFHALVKFSINTDIDGTKGRYRIVISDITDRKLAEAKLKEQKIQLELALQASNTGLWDWDLKTDKVFYSPEWKKQIGYADEEISNELFELENRVHPDDLEKAKSRIMEFIKHPYPNYENEFRFRHKDGSYRWILTQASLIMDEQGKPIRMLGDHIDITERKNVEEEILRQKNRAEMYLNIASVMFIGLDASGSVEIVNQKACDILKCSEQEIIGLNWFDVFIPARIRNDVKSVFKQLMKGEIDLIEYFENPVLTKDGIEKQISWHNTFIKDNDDNIIGILGSGEDISEKRKLQQQLLQAQKMEAVGIMAGGIAHDFNNILAIIMGNLDLVIDDLTPDNPMRGDLEEALKASNRAKDLVSQILAFSRKEPQKLIPIRPQSLIKETLKLLRSTTPTTVSIIQNISQDCGRIKANPTGLHQILMNIITNAVHSMDEKGEITVSLQEVNLSSDELDQLPPMTQFFSQKTPGKYARLSVIDNGTGIDEKTLERIFDPFFTTKEVGKGTGMGLSVVMGIVESHGGFIDVDSEPGRGSTFNAFFPITDEEEIVETETTKPPQTGTERILLVDDEEALLVLGKRILDKLGYEVTAENSSEKALEIFRSAPHQFDLIITDQAMPDMSGTELVAEIVKERPDIPVILCTGYSSKVSEENAEELGISKFITKPYSKKIMSETVREVLNRKL